MNNIDKYIFSCKHKPVQSIYTTQEYEYTFLESIIEKLIDSGFYRNVTLIQTETFNNKNYGKILLVKKEWINGNYN